MDLVQRLRASGCVYAEEEAALLNQAAEGAALEALVERRVAGQPLEQVLGWAEFCGLRVFVEPGVFVPRRRTAVVVAAAAQLAATGAVVVDLGCGTGAIAAALAAARPDLVVHACDLDPAAVTCARRNLDPARVHHGDLFDALPADLRGQVDLVVANAPYVPTAAIATMPTEARDHEAPLALDGGHDGLEVQRRVVAEAAPWLSPAGAVIIETSAAQRSATRSLMRAHGLRTRTLRDDEIDGTAVVGHRDPSL